VAGGPCLGFQTRETAYYSTGKVESIKSSNTNGANVSYTYDDLNRFSSVVDNRLPGSNPTNYTYDNASNLVTVAYPNGVTSTITYDELNRLTELSTSASGTQIADYKYTLGFTGNRTNATEQSGRTLQWTYNGIYQLTNESITGDPANNGSASYTLDPVGNRTAASSTFSGFTPGFGSYNLNDQLSGETYDNNGNVTGTTNGNSYVYDSENHVIQMVKGTTTIGMRYDAFGNRVSKAVTTAGVTTTTQYLVDDLNPTGYPQVVDELVGPIGSAAVQRTYTYGLQRISQDQYISGWVLSYYQYDGGGSVRQLTNSVGQVTDSYEYDAFGNSFTKQGTTPNNYLYRGEQYDSDLGLYYLRARYYNPSTGRFMSRDPEAGNRFSPASLHKYLYAGGDPVNMVDPSGRDMFETGAILAHEFLKVAVLRAGISACLFKVFTSIEKDLENPKSLGNGMGIASDVFSCAVTIGAAFVAMAFI
jgi:RHS repeat-associated protein